VASETDTSKVLGHLVELERELVTPRGGRLDLARHLRKLVPDDRVLDEELAESFPAVRVVKGVLVDDTALADGLVGDRKTLVVEAARDKMTVRKLEESKETAVNSNALKKSK
jgi:hypothetical protein